MTKQEEKSNGLWMTLCEYAAVHEDRTMTVVRGGLHEAKVKKFPCTFYVGVVGEVGAGIFPAGKVPFVIYITGSDMSSTEPAVWGSVIIQDEKVPTLFSLPVKAPVKSNGTLTIEMIVGTDLTIRRAISIHVQERDS